MVLPPPPELPPLAVVKLFNSVQVDPFHISVWVGAGGAGGSYTSALAFGGDSPGATSNTEQWNGSSWTEVAELGTARQSGGSGGSMVAGVFFGGWTGTALSALTEEWTIPATTKTLTVS